MKQLICDRCGKVIDYSQGRPVFSITRTNTGIIMDMCKECRIALIDFMHEEALNNFINSFKDIKFIDSDKPKEEGEE